MVKSAKSFYEKLYNKQTSTAATIEFFSKVPNRKKISNEHFIDVYNSWGNLDTIGVTSRTGISMIFYIKKVILENYIPIST